CLSMIMALIIPIASAQQKAISFYLSPSGSDQHEGTKAKPFASAEYALAQIQKYKKAHPDQAVEMLIEDGKYYLAKPLEINVDGLTIKEIKERTVVITAAHTLKLQWTKSKNNMWTAKVPAGLQLQRLYATGELLIRARYHNYDPKILPFNGYAEDAISPEPVKSWKKPNGAIVHALHIGRWGGFHYLVTGKDANGELRLEGGLQNNR